MVGVVTALAIVATWVVEKAAAEKVVDALVLVQAQTAVTWKAEKV